MKTPFCLPGIYHSPREKWLLDLMIGIPPTIFHPDGRRRWQHGRAAVLPSQLGVSAFGFGKRHPKTPIAVGRGDMAGWIGPRQKAVVLTTTP